MFNNLRKNVAVDTGVHVVELERREIFARLVAKGYLPSRAEPGPDVSVCSCGAQYHKDTGLPVLQAAFLPDDIRGKFGLPPARSVVRLPPELFKRTP